MSSDAVARVRYYPGQFLRTPDFIDEQRYHLAMRRRHNIGHHTFGIVTGLGLTEMDGRPAVEPGMAVDGYGRELVLVERTPLDVPRAFSVRGTDRLDVWIAYRLLAADPAPSGYASCTDDDTSYRIVEQPVLRYTATDDAENDDRRTPSTVPAADRDFGPARTPPDDPLADWPVFLGTLTRGADGSVTTGGDGRSYAGLVGASVRTPSGSVSVQLGATRDTDPFEFAVRIADLPKPDVPRLGVLRDGAVVAAGETNLLGNVQVSGGVQLAAGPPVDDLAETPAQPWTLSRVADIAGGSELRLQMSGPLGSAADEVVVGTWTSVTAADGSQQEQFAPCLTIGATGAVTVHGDLLVEGALLSKERRPLQLSANAEAFVTSAFLSGVGGASAVVGTFYDSPFRAPGPAPTPQAAADAVLQLSDELRLAEFAAWIRLRNSNMADFLVTALTPPPPGP